MQTKTEKCLLVGGGNDGMRVDLAESEEQMEFPVESAAGVPAVEIYRRRRVNGVKIVASDGRAVFDFALRRRAPEAVRT
jgi:hypothetical protein